MKRIIERLTPFIVLGIIIVAVFFGVMLLAYLFLIGAILGCILFLARLIRDKFFPSEKPKKQQKTSGRIIDTNDWKKL